MDVSLEPHVQFRWGFQQSVALKIKHAITLKTRLLVFSSSDSFCLITSHIVIHSLLSKETVQSAEYERIFTQQ